ncbi:MAG: prepilin-type N-terminal cleavage/methylation domain-containing protein [Kiritimatiellae bacterium]|nr:prepilin-type N-terminal cleavage/methylation domain-containing protein [Kiritimatiellia bacterium]
MKRNGFTLVEMVVVIALLSLMAHLAVRQLSRQTDARRTAAANRQLEEIAAAVYAMDAMGEPTGFLVDTGRLPRALPGIFTNLTEHIVPLTISELWRRPDDLPDYAIRPATPENLCVPESDKVALADNSVRIPCGWRGPYLRLPTGKDRLVDPWGNPFETPDDAGYARLLDIHSVAVANGSPIMSIRHLGSDARPDDRAHPSTEKERDGAVSLPPSSKADAALEIYAVGLSSGAETELPPSTVTFRWYAPCGGAITGDIYTAAVSTHRFEGLPLGYAYVRVSVPTATSTVHRVSLRPGDNWLKIKFPVP